MTCFRHVFGSWNHGPDDFQVTSVRIAAATAWAKAAACAACTLAKAKSPKDRPLAGSTTCCRSPAVSGTLQLEGA